MKYVIASDLHGSAFFAEKIIKILERAKASLSQIETVQKDPKMLRFAWDLMEEAVAVGRAAGVPLGDEVVDSAMMVICKMPADVKTSMLQDVEAGRETEVEAFAGTVCRLAEKFGIDVPNNKLVLEKIKGL